MNESSVARRDADDIESLTVVPRRSQETQTKMARKPGDGKRYWWGDSDPWASGSQCTLSIDLADLLRFDGTES